mgnify:CR=1 FL=1
MNYLKRIILRTKIKIRRKFKNKILKLSEHEKICYEIFRKYLYFEESKLLMSPEITTLDISNSYKRYICIGDLENPNVAIILTHSMIKIINHSYVYSIDIHRQLYLKMIGMFDRKLKKERNLMEKAIHDNITEGLSKLIK